MKSRICLIRHGITEGNLRRLYYGHTDIPLAPEGVEALKKQVADGLYIDSDNALYYTSGLLRTEQTFELIYGKKTHEVMPGLMETNFGVFEMLCYEELKDREDYQKWINGDMMNQGPPEGESQMQFYERVTNAFEEVKAKHMQHVLSLRHKAEEALSVAVCHGGTISAIMEYLYPGEKEHFYYWITDPGHGYILTLENAEIIGYEKF